MLMLADVSIIMQPSTFTHIVHGIVFPFLANCACMHCGLSNLRFWTSELANLGHFSGSHSLTFTIITEPQQHILIFRITRTWIATVFLWNKYILWYWFLEYNYFLMFLICSFEKKLFIYLDHHKDLSFSIIMAFTFNII